MTYEAQLLVAIFTGIAFLLLLIIKIRLNAFLSLLLASIWIGLLSGIGPSQMMQVISEGMGDTLAFVATIVGLGTIFGAILEHTGGARQLSHFLVKKTGDKKARIAVLVSGFVVAIPVFFDVAFIILFPVIKALSRRLKKPLLYFALPLLTGIALTHSFIPPTPGPVAVADILQVDLGWMIALGIPIAFPVAVICGLIVAKKLSFPTKEDFSEDEEVIDTTQKSDLVLTTNIAILIPLLLMVLNAVLKTLLDESIITPFTGHEYLLMIGHPFSALILATLYAIYILGRKAGLNKDELFRISNNSLAPAGTVILITGAGGVLKATLIATGVGSIIAEQMNDNPASLLLLAYGVAAVVRILQGSATISMITGAGIVGPVMTLMPDLTMPDKTLIALAIAAGSIIASHVNDSGFWIINRFLKHEVTETLRSWTILSSVISITSAAILLLLSFFI